MKDISEVAEHVSEERLRQDIETNADFGSIQTDQGRGRTVLTGTEANKGARDYLVERLEDADLEVRIDAVGNIAGRWLPETADENLSSVALGSHLDSVPNGGIFDGPLGVYSALESVRAAQEADVEFNRPIEVVCFTEEEGQRFSDGLLGSFVSSGKLPVEEALSLTDSEGVTLEEALEDIGYSGQDKIEASNWNSWLELHVEQSDRLEKAGVPVGVVTTITGITHCHAEIEGESNHAGTTPMNRRADALAAASELVLDVESCALDTVSNHSETAVGTVGKLDVDPNATNVVPGRVDMGIDIRDVDYASMERIVKGARKGLKRLERERGVKTEFKRQLDLKPTPMGERCREAAHSAGRKVGVETMDVHSGAAHDTMNVAEVTDTALLFAPSQDGISHSPLEWTDWGDCTNATRVLTGTMAQLALE
ncbi:MAG: Zn-dependent hydrolase [Halobacteria archaeon]|nr:Zn-dependent hydrolase [Halobacteria archaeon]